MRDITKRLRVLRVGQNVTQRHVALRAHMPLSRYWEIENGYRQPSDDELHALARVLECSPSDIVPSEVGAAS